MKLKCLFILNVEDIKLGTFVFGFLSFLSGEQCRDSLYYGSGYQPLAVDFYFKIQSGTVS